MRHKRSFKLFSIHRRYLLFTAILVTVFLTVGILFNSFFSIRTVRVISEKHYSLKGLSSMENMNILFTSTTSLEKNLKAQNPQLKEVKITKQYPDALIITPVFLTDFALFKVSDGYYILANDGTILERARTSRNLPVVHYYQQFSYSSYNPGEQLTMTDLKTSLFFLKALREAGAGCDSIDINSLDMIVCNILNKKIVLTTKKDINMQRYELQTILRQFKIEGKDFKTLDIRFDKPVVTF